STSMMDPNSASGMSPWDWPRLWTALSRSSAWASSFRNIRSTSSANWSRAGAKIMTEKDSVSSIPDAALLGRAVKSACSSKHNKGVKHPRWIAVKDAFQLGSGYAGELCRRFGLDPDEEVAR